MSNPRIRGAEEGPRRLKGVHSKVDPVSYILEMKMKFDSPFKLDQRTNASRRVVSRLPGQGRQPAAAMFGGRREIEPALFVRSRAA